jgi:hypothetical protein
MIPYQVSSTIQNKEPHTMTVIVQTTMELAINTLMQKIRDDYYVWTLRGRDPAELTEINHNMITEFNKNISISTGKKYIKILKGNSVWGFVVNTDDDKKFNRGDILKAAGYNTPARNQARGNILKGDFSWVRWTGTEYL